MKSGTLLEELPTELDLRLELDADLSVFLPAAALQLSGLQPGEPLMVDVHPLSLRLDPASAAGAQSPSGKLSIAHLDTEGRIHLPFEPPRLTSRAVLLQVRQRGTRREIHLLADSTR
ncbi:MAG TPA: hypothetical protein VK899_04010 [Gemmatimonadales bacterium]|nr:hypothetical protein [Gemmatimonadales bacterium]